MVPKGGTVDSPGCVVLRGFTAKEARDWAEYHHGSDAWDVVLTRDTTQPRTPPGTG